MSRLDLVWIGASILVLAAACMFLYAWWHSIPGASGVERASHPARGARSFSQHHARLRRRRRAARRHIDRLARRDTQANTARLLKGNHLR